MALHERALALWSKSGEPCHSLLAHFLDTAAVALEVLLREPSSTRVLYAEDLALPEEQALLWAAFFTGLHDLGKASPVFQRAWEPGAARLRATGLEWDELYFSQEENWVAHGVLTELFLEDALQELDLPRCFYRPLARGLGAHHGFVATSTELAKARHHYHMEPWPWKEVRKDLVLLFKAAMGLPGRPRASCLDAPATLRLMALASFADWVASASEYFPYGRDPAHSDSYFQQARTLAEGALDQIGWQRKRPLSLSVPAFSEVFPFAPNPLQGKVAEALEGVRAPALLLVEAPMGLGKTEAALYAHLLLQAEAEHRGLYAALPTQATGNGLFPRVRDFLAHFAQDTSLELQLQHGAAVLNPEYLALRPDRVGEKREGGVVAQTWFSSRKRAMLADYGVGTLDQALLGVLKVRHHFVRLWGLMNRTVLLDEVHAYDTYTSGLLQALLKWLKALGSSPIVMTATLTPSKRRSLLESYGLKLPVDLGPYPRVVVGNNEAVQVYPVAVDESRIVDLSHAPAEPPNLAQEALSALPGCVGLVLNTVNRAQQVYQALGEGKRLCTEEILRISEVDRHLERSASEDHEQSTWMVLQKEIRKAPYKANIPVGKRLSDGTLVFLLHARFPAEERALREQVILNLFGKAGPRPKRAILVATQVIEQSLDLDFDLLFSDLAPIDLLLQRSGRLHRHKRARPEGHKTPLLKVAGLGQEPRFGEPLFWDRVYEEYVLLATWQALQGRRRIQIPDDLEDLLEEVYERGPRSFPEGLRAQAEEAWEKFERTRKSDEETARNLGLFDPKALVGPARHSEDVALDLKLDDDSEDGRTQRLLTRLGEPSVTVALLYQVGERWALDPEGRRPVRLKNELSAEEVRDLYGRTVRLSRYPIPQVLLQKDPPPAWARHGVLRGVRPLKVGEFIATGEGRGVGVDLDPELGVIYRSTP